MNTAMISSAEQILIWSHLVVHQTNEWFLKVEKWEDSDAICLWKTMSFSRIAYQILDIGIGIGICIGYPILNYKKSDIGIW